MIQPLDQSIIELLNASRDDEATLDLPVASRIFGFHAQQAVEKLLKALIGAHAEKYKYTHDLAELGRHCSTLGEQTPVAAPVLAELTDFAGLWRYQEPTVLKPERRAEFRQAVKDLRLHLLGRLAALRPGVDWTPYR